MIRLRATYEAVRSFSVGTGEQETPETLIAQRRQAETAHETCAQALRELAEALTQAGSPSQMGSLRWGLRQNCDGRTRRF